MPSLPGRARRARGASSPVRRAATCAVAVAIAAAVGPRAIRAQDPPPAARPLTLDAVLARAQAASPMVAAARAEAAAAGFRVAPARALPDPRAQLGVMNRDLPSLRAMETVGMDQLQVMQMLPLGGKRGLAGRAAEARAAAAAGAADARLWDARTAAAVAFYDLWEAERLRALADETRGLLRAAADAADAMYRVGQVRQADVLRARLELTRLDDERLGLDAARATAAARLGAALDLTIDPDTLAPRLPALPDASPDAEALVARALDARPSLGAARRSLAAAEADERRARRELVPDLEVGAQLARRPPSATPVFDALTMGRRADWMTSVMVGASLPVFARQRQLAMRDEAGAMRRAADAEVRAVAAETRGRVRELAAELRRARDAGRLASTTLLPQAAATRDAAAIAYRTGGVDAMTLLDAHLAVHRARQQRIVWRAAEGRALAELETLVGAPLVDAARTLPIDQEVP